MFMQYIQHHTSRCSLGSASLLFMENPHTSYFQVCQWKSSWSWSTLFSSRPTTSFLRIEKRLRIIKPITCCFFTGMWSTLRELSELIIFILCRYLNELFGKDSARMKLSQIMGVLVDLKELCERSKEEELQRIKMKRGQRWKFIDKYLLKKKNIKGQMKIVK